MKSKRFLTFAFVLSLVLLLGQAYAQKVGIAADKQKQANLEKNMKRQAELKKKYNSLSPEQAAEARKRADEYKRNGGKVPSTGSATSTGTKIKSPNSPAVVSKTPEQQKQGNVKKKTGSGKPVWMNEKGKAKPTAAPVLNKQGKAESKSSIPGKVKNPSVKKKTVNSKVSVKTSKPAEKSSAVEKATK